MDAAGPRDDPVAREALLVHAEVHALVNDQAVDLVERSLVDEELDALARGLLARFVLAGDAFGAARELGRLVASSELIEAILEGMAGPLLMEYRGRPSRKVNECGRFSAPFIDLHDAACHTRFPMTPLAVGIILACVVALTSC